MPHTVDMENLVSELKQQHLQLYACISSANLSHSVQEASLLTRFKTVAFLKVILSIVIYPLLWLISWSFTTWCLSVTGGGSVGECDRLSQSGDFWVHYNIVIVTYLLTDICVPMEQVWLDMFPDIGCEWTWGSQRKTICLTTESRLLVPTVYMSLNNLCNAELIRSWCNGRVRHYGAK